MTDNLKTRIPELNQAGSALTDAQLKRIYPHSTPTNRQKFLPFINEYAPRYGITTLARLAAFLAQVGHESAELAYVQELASGKAYEGRRDLGNTFKGDGVRFKGRGLIQITGRKNYMDLSRDLGVDFVNHPQWLELPEYAVLSAFWFWDKHSLNSYATLCEDDFKRITKIINGGYNGYANRAELWARAKDVLK